MRRPARLAAWLVALAALVAHGRALGHGFVYDDHRFVERNRAIESLADVGSFFTDPTTASAAQGIEPDIYRPLRTLHFALDRALFGLAPAGWHLASLALHAAASVLVLVFLLRRLLGRVRAPGLVPGRSPPGERSGLALAAATIGALVFAVHPVGTESVAWVSSRGDLLACTLVLLALEAFARPSRRATLVGVALGVLALLAKESALVLFALVPLAHVSLPPWSRPSWRTVAVRTGAILAATIGYLVWRGHVLPGASDLPALAQIGFPDGGRLGALRGFLSAVTWYARRLVPPGGFAFDRNVRTDPVPTSFADPDVVVGAAILGTLVVVGLVALRRGRPALATALLGAVVALGPVSNVVVPLKAFAAERFLYPVAPFLALGVALLALDALARVRRVEASRAGVARAALVGVVGVLVVGLAALSVARSGPWHDEEALWTAVKADEPMSPRAYEGLGFGYLRAGRLGAAERAFGTYRELEPDDGKVRAELAAVFQRLAGELTPADATAYEGTDLAQRRSYVLRKAIEESRAAWGIWQARGVERGRGDATLVRATLMTWLDSAYEFGDLRETAFVASILERDDVARTGRVSYARRRVPALLAARVLTDRAERGPEARLDAERTRVRAERLRAVGVSPERGDLDAAAEVVARIEPLLAEQPGDAELRRKRALLLGRRVAALGASVPRGELELLRADLATLVRAFPGEQALRDALDGLEGRRPR